MIATDAPFPAALPTPRSPSLMSAPEHTHSLTSEERSGAAESLAGATSVIMPRCTGVSV